MNMSQVTQLIYKSKEDFEENLKQTLVTDTLRNVIVNSVPVEESEHQKLNDSNFKDNFNQILSPMSRKLVDDFQNVANFKVGKVFASMTTAVNDSVALESEYRTNKIMTDIRLGNIDINNSDMNTLVFNAFSKEDLTVPDIRKQYIDTLRFIFSSEDAEALIDDIKESVKAAIDETEAKNELVEATNKEIIDYKKEIAPPDDTVLDAEEEEFKLNNPDSAATDEVPESPGEEAIGQDNEPVEAVADKVKPTESLNLFTTEGWANKYIPTNAVEFNETELPDLYLMASEAFNAQGDVKDKMNLNLDVLKLSIEKGNITLDDKMALGEKYETLVKIANEAYSYCNEFAKSMQKLGLTQNGLLNASESTLCVANNMIRRFITKDKGITPEMLPFTSNENVLSNAFDLVQMRQIMNGTEFNKTITDDYFSRESAFFKNLLNWQDSDIREKAKAVIDISFMKTEAALTPNFFTDFKIKAHELNVGKDNKDSNAEVMRRVKDKFEGFWKRELNSDEIEIVAATTNNEDVTEVCPTPFEKFAISLTKEAMIPDNSTESVVVGQLDNETRSNIILKAKLLTTALKTAEAIGIVSQDDFNEFEKFCNIIEVVKHE